jgi:hypothetical protein
MDFLKTILDNPDTLDNIASKIIDPLTHDFDSESLSDRLYSLYSVINNLGTYDDIVSVRPILQKYEIELRFIKEMNKVSLRDRSVNEHYFEMISKLRERTLSNII